MNLLVQVLATILQKLPDDVVKNALDKLLDVIEDAIEKSETQWDDKFVLPLINFIRLQLQIEDND